MSLEDVPIVHATDPRTSYEAAAAVTQGGKRGAHCAAVLAAVRRYPGRTAGELGEVTGLGRVEAARRLSDLKRLGEVFMGERRVCAVQGTGQYAWYAVPGELRAREVMR
jgi:hypothetical protein